MTEIPLDMDLYWFYSNIEATDAFRKLSKDRQILVRRYATVGVPEKMPLWLKQLEKAALKEMSRVVDYEAEADALAEQIISGP